MAKHERLGLTAVRTEGAILPASILQRIHREDPGLDGLKPEQYDLTGDRLREAASRAWTALQGPWMNFKAERAKLAPSEAGTTITRNRWLYPILRELHFGPLEPLRESLKYDEKEFPVSHKFGHSPLHFIGCNLALDKRTPGAVGAAKMSPHGLLQSCLNSTKENLWGFVTNGLQWRVLRDDNSLSRQSMVEFDLESIFEGQLYDEFLLFFLVCHRSRVQSELPEQCWLEQWSQAAGEDGKRALNTLRDGVQKSIEALGQGFLKHPANHELRSRIRNGELDKQDYYRQLLRMVYRLLFLFVAEDRGLLLDPKAKDTAKALFNEHFSTQRLRLLAERMRGSNRHHDLFDPLKMVLSKLGEPAGCPELALPALGGFLFAESTAPDLDSSEIANADLLEAVRFLAVTREGGRLARVDYKNLGTEELGSVYESLLELHPDLASDGTWFELKSASGNERKTSGSYYTPDSLIQCLLDTALDPVVNEAVKKAGTDPEERAKAILDLRVIDPAVGSGHFLIAASHRLAKRLAQVRTGEDEPSPDATRHALREVVGKCLYGIDLNPMAAELCKVSLWIEALEPGRPLNFLDHHIVIGNSLLGTTPELIAKGIPDAAFDAIEGDDKALCAVLKKQNKQERGPQGNLFDPAAFAGKELLKAWQELESLPDETLEDIRTKDKTFRAAEAALEMRKLMANAWCASFVLPKTPPKANQPTGGQAITTGTLRRLANSHALTDEESRAIQEVNQRFAFLHPQLTFPEVFVPRNGKSGGFDLVLGNPPWERVKLQEKEFFAERFPEISIARKKADRDRLIKQLLGTPLHLEFLQAKHDAEAASAFMRKSNRYPLAGRGDVNTYAVFAENFRSLLNSHGRAGMVVPSGIASDDTLKHLFQAFVESGGLHSLYDFENSKLLFADVAPVVKFCLLTVGSATPPNRVAPEFMFFATEVSELSDDQRRFTLTSDDIALLNPNTKTCPIFRTQRDAEITKAIYRRVPVLIREEEVNGNPWGISFLRMFDMSNDSSLFRTFEELDAARGTLNGNRWNVCQTVVVDISEPREITEGTWLPLYEAKLFHQFNHRPSTFEGIPAEDRFKMKAPTVSSTIEALRSPDYCPLSRFWVHESDVDHALKGNDNPWLITFRGMSNVMTNSRNAVFSVIPRVAVGNSSPALVLTRGLLVESLLANANAFIFDYVTRQKLAGANLNFFIVNQLPVLARETYFESCPWDSGSTLASWIASRVLELTYAAHDLAPFARGLGYDGPPFIWDEERRFLLRAELDAAFFHLYGIARADVDYIMETFPIVKRKDIAAHGSYRTKEAILSIYDEMAETNRVSAPYSTCLNPLPANGWTPPPLPPLEDLITANPISGETPKAKRSVATPSSNGTTAVAPRMANLFEEAPKTLFDAAEDSELELESVAEPPVALGPIVINGQSAQLVEVKALDPTRTQYKVILDSTGELKSFVSPPAIITL